MTTPAYHFPFSPSLDENKRWHNPPQLAPGFGPCLVYYTSGGYYNTLSFGEASGLTIKKEKPIIKVAMDGNAKMYQFRYNIYEMSFSATLPSETMFLPKNKVLSDPSFDWGSTYIYQVQDSVWDILNGIQKIHGSDLASKSFYPFAMVRTTSSYSLRLLTPLVDSFTSTGTVSNEAAENYKLCPYGFTHRLSNVAVNAMKLPNPVMKHGLPWYTLNVTISGIFDVFTQEAWMPPIPILPIDPSYL